MRAIEIIIAAVIVLSLAGTLAIRSTRRGGTGETSKRPPGRPLSSQRGAPTMGAPVAKAPAPPKPRGETAPEARESAPPGGSRGATEVSDIVVTETSADHVVVAPSPAAPRGRPKIAGAFGALFKRRALDDTFWGELEDSLILADVGLDTAMRIVEESRLKVRQAKLTDPALALQSVREAMQDSLLGVDRHLMLEGAKPVVWLFVGVNGVGKTTTIGKVANQLCDSGKTVMMAGADTFRAAAADQLGLWAQRAKAEIVSGAPGSDPASVFFDAITSARARGFDIVLGDTAGRLHNKFNLIEELKKIYRTVEKAQGTLGEVLLVLDATVGQNGLAQAKVFSEAVGVTGVVLTKLDGSAKGGIAFAIEQSFKIPVKLVGVGEGIDDLAPFDPKEYVESLTSLN